MRRCARLVIVMVPPVCLLMCASLLVGADSSTWSRFRGPAGAGVSTATGLPHELSIERTLRLRIDLPPGKSSPVLARDRLFVTGWDGDRRLMVCIERPSGKQLWVRAVQKRHSHATNPLNDPAAPTPAVDGTGVYAFFPDAGLVAYDLNGVERWAVPLGPFQSVHGVASSPVVADGLVVLAVEQQGGQSFIAAYDAQSGARRWHAGLPDVGQQGYSTPFVYTSANALPQLVMSRSGEIGGWSLRDGTPIWWVRGTGTQSYSLPAVSGDTLYAAADGDTVEGGMAAWERLLEEKGRVRERSLRVKEDWADDTLQRADNAWGNRDGVLDEHEWRQFVGNNRPRAMVAVRLGGEGDVTDSHVLWRTTRGVPTVASPVSYGDILYYVRDGGIFAAIDPSSGAVFKEGRLPGAAEKYFASPVAADGKIYVASEQGKLVVIRAGRDWEVLSTHDVGEDVYATPAISEDARVYVRTSKALYVFSRHP